MHSKKWFKFVQSLYNAYIGSDASMFEINPVLKTSDNKIMAVDAKVNIDDNALYRQANMLKCVIFVKKTQLKWKLKKLV
jgi:succinyl-CoA synthetase beta subunit